MQIVLLRHGEPALNKKGKRSRKEAVQFVFDYDSVGIYPPSFTPVKLNENEVDTVLTSNLNRAVSTAEEIFGSRKLYSTELFREFERKVFSFPNIRLPLNWWLIGSRGLWFLGYNKGGIESFSSAKKRARFGMRVLEEKAEENQKIVLVAHGLLNHYLVKYLRKGGWTLVYDGGSGYLSQRLLVRYRDD